MLHGLKGDEFTSVQDFFDFLGKRFAVLEGFRAFENRRRRRVGANEQERLVQPGQQSRILNPRVSQIVQQPPQRFFLTRAELQTGLFQRFNQLLRCHLVRQCNARAAAPLAIRWTGLSVC